MQNPQSLESEQQIIGAVLKDPNAVDEVIATLKPSDFYYPKHNLIFEAISQVNGKTEPCDLITVAEQLKKNGKLENIGGRVYLATLTEYAISTANVGYHAKIVKDKSTLRQLMTIGDHLRAKATEIDANPENIIDKSSDAIFRLSETSHNDDTAHISEVLVETLDHISKIDTGQIQIMKTGFTMLDSIFLGLIPTNLTIIAGYTSHGKTQLALQIARYLAGRNHNVLYVSHEMSRFELAGRLLMEQSLVDISKAYKQKNLIKDTDWDKLAIAQKNLNKLGIYICDRSTMNKTELLSLVRQKIRKNNIQIVFVDYLQLMTSSKGKENRNQEVASISRGLKEIGMRLGISVVALSQLSRPVGGVLRQPRLTDLKESGALEQDANNVLFPYHDESGCRIIVAKQRGAKTGSASMAWDNERGIWRDVEYLERRF